MKRTVTAISGRRWIVAGSLVLLGACAGRTKPFPPPEGEWLPWEPKGKATEKQKAEDLDAPSDQAATEDTPKAKSEKSQPSSPSVSCRGKDNVRDSVCLAKGELAAGDECPSALPKKAENEDKRGTFEVAPSGAKRDVSLESGDQCCFAWCVHVNAIPASKLKCKKNESKETALCFEAPRSGTRSPGEAPYSECPAGLKHTAKKGRRLGYPQAVLVKKGGDDSSRHACCYEACVKQ